MPPTATGMSTKILNSPLNNSLPKIGYNNRDCVGLRQQNKNTMNIPLPWYYQLPLEQATDSESNWVSRKKR